ncbi:MAG: glycosyltransferase, partial [Chloroflexota bacterium]
WSFPLLLRNTQIIHLRGLSPETISLARIARRMEIKSLCVPMASGAYGDVALFPSNRRHNPRAFDRISALTEPLRNELIAWGFPAAHIDLIPNGVDTALFSCPASPAPGIIFVGQFRPEKRVELLLNAFALVQSDYPRISLTLLGGGHSFHHFQQMAVQLGVVVNFVPNTDSAGVRTHLQANSIFVQSGISEGMSNALLEAMAVGLAPVVSDTPANRAVITPEIDGLCYAPDSSEALASQLIRLISDDLLRQRLGTAARQTVERRFTLDFVAAQYLALYERMLGENS